MYNFSEEVLLLTHLHHYRASGMPNNTVRYLVAELQPSAVRYYTQRFTPVHCDLLLGFIVSSPCSTDAFKRAGGTLWTLAWLWNTNILLIIWKQGFLIWDTRLDTLGRKWTIPSLAVVVNVHFNDRIHHGHNIALQNLGSQPRSHRKSSVPKETPV